MDYEEKVELTKKNINQALNDYAAHTDLTEHLDNVTDDFIDRLARDSVAAKQNLRNLFRKSPVWDEQLDALVINGTRTHDPDYNLIYQLGHRILAPALYDDATITYGQADRIILFFADPDCDESTKDSFLHTIKEIAPKAYAPGKKLSRVFKNICQVLGIADETAGSEFQKLYAQFADELSTRRIGFKLYVSINPAHFLTMSNPKRDNRGNTLTSCHSFNSTEYEYNNGCSGYARDEVSFIAFTVSDPSDPATLNNRKTSRQVYAYEPGNGLLMQSRFYNTSGGTRGAQEESKLYRDLIQREISMLEGLPNLWHTSVLYGDKSYLVTKGCGFGGYPDWEYEEFAAMVSTHDCVEDPKPLIVGTYGLCIECAEELSEGLYCSDCESRCHYCFECEERVSETFTVYDRHGNAREVCEECRDEYYRECEECGEYHPADAMYSLGDGDGYVCQSCYDSYYSTCEECGGVYRNDDLYAVQDQYGSSISVCEDCRESHYFCCDSCHEWHPDRWSNTVHDARGRFEYVCDDCLEEKYQACDECGEYYPCNTMVDGLCPNCHANAQEESEEIA